MSFDIYLSPPHPTGKELAYVSEVLKSNWLAPAGAHLSELESRIEKYLAADQMALALNSGTAAIHLGLRLLGVGKGDLVLCQSLTFVASVNPITYLGATPVFIDSETTTWNLCPELLEHAIIEHLQKGIKPKAIVAVHLYGMPYQVREIHQIADKYQIPILEDSAEALGSCYNNQKCGTFGEVSVFSFNGNKIITTGGGGALITNTKDQKEQALKWATQAKETTPHFEHRELGYNYRMSNLNAAVGCAQLEVLETYVARRREIFRYYKNELEELKDLSFLKEPEACFSNRWLSVLCCKDEKQREQIRQALTDNRIEARPVWKPMHRQPLYTHEKSYLNGVSDAVFAKGLCLPSGSQLTYDQLSRIISIIKENA